MVRVLSAVAVLGSLVPSIAEACSGYAPCVPFSSPAADGGIPGNAPAIVIGSRRAPPRNADQVALLNESEAEVSFTLEQDGTSDRYFLRAALEDQARYTLRFADTCASADAGTSFEVPFETGASVPVPSSFGTVSLTENGAGMIDVPTQCGSCTVARTAAFARFQLTPSAEAAPWLPLTRFILRVDGALWAVSDYGSGASDSRSGGSLLHGRSFDDVYAVCRRGSEAVFDDGLSEGTHQLTWTAQLAGMGEIPLGSLVVTLTCPSQKAIPSEQDTCAWGTVGDGGTAPDRVPGRGCAGELPSVLALAVGAALLKRRR